MNHDLRFHFIQVVWGADFVDSLLNVALPSCLAQGNLPNLQSASRSLLAIYTSPSDAQRILDSRSYKLASRVIKTLVIPLHNIDFSTKGEPYDTMTQCHVQAMLSAAEDNSAMVFLTPDFVCAEGMFSRLEQIALGGKKIVVLGSARVQKETFVPAFLAKHFCQTTGIASVCPRALVRLALQHLHSISIGHFWNSSTFPKWSSHLYWQPSKEGLLIRGFHLHPLMINPSRHLKEIPKTFDGDYVDEVCEDRSKLYVVEDSDDLCGFEFSGRSRVLEVLGKADPSHVARWMRKNTKPLHLDFVRHRIRLHSGDLDDADWSQCESKSDEVVDTIFRHYHDNPLES